MGSIGLLGTGLWAAQNFPKKRRDPQFLLFQLAEKISLGNFEAAKEILEEISEKEKRTQSTIINQYVNRKKKFSFILNREWKEVLNFIISPQYFSAKIPTVPLPPTRTEFAGLLRENINTKKEIKSLLKARNRGRNVLTALNNQSGGVVGRTEEKKNSPEYYKQLSDKAEKRLVELETKITDLSTKVAQNSVKMDKLGENIPPYSFNDQVIKQILENRDQFVQNPKLFYQLLPFIKTKTLVENFKYFYL